MLELTFGISLALNLLLLLTLSSMRKEVSRALKLAQAMHDRAIYGQPRDKRGRFAKKEAPE